MMLSYFRKTGVGLVMLVSFVAILMIACGDSDDSDTPPPTPTPVVNPVTDPTAIPTPVATPSGPTFFGSCRVDVNPRCIEYTGLGSSQSLQEGCEDPGQTWSFDRCDTTGAISFCRQNPTSATTLTEVFTYFYFVDPGAWQDFCEMNAGTWEIL